MGSLNIQNLSVAFGDRDLLHDIGFTLSSSSRAALAGANGSGKSTLMKAIAGLITPDSLSRDMTKGMRIAYLPQSDIVLGELSVREEASKGFERFRPLLGEKKSIEEQLGSMVDDVTSRPLLVRLHDIEDILQTQGYHQRDALVTRILQGLGFSLEDFDRPCAEFSGGWQMRVSLARLLVSTPDIMLLDEPTNYLDIEAAMWLRNYLKSFPGGVMIVSHDQYFLDETVTEVYELFNGNLTRYSGNYTAYLTQREMELQTLEKAWKQQQAEISRTEQFIEKFRYKATKSKQVQSRIKQLEKIEPIEIPGHLRKLSFSFPPAPHSGNDVVIIEHLEKHYGSQQIFSDLSFVVRKGERLGVTGRNGMGKSTLLRLLAGRDADYGGMIRLGSGVSTGYFAQDTADMLDPANTVLQEVESTASLSDIPRLRNLLGSFLFSNDDIDKKVTVLSGGERSRLALLKILLHPANLLILDEPTNHLDINAKEMLLDALKAYDGTIVFVSHDRHFIEKTATRILYLSHETPEFFEGDYSYFAWKLEQKEAIPAPSMSIGTVQSSYGEKPKDGALHWKDENRRRNRIKILKTKAEDILLEIASCEKKIARLNSEMSQEDTYTVPEKLTALFSDRQKEERRHAALTEEWLETTAAMEELEHES
ncbi:ribosomal protection-like ABC-F family protein [Parasphaerochaeta coccoides]|uniref:ABC transporter related protein n=1 Tax=Parasphaerochaeta coccoides (strain ATCC BAA-1237 / DSM 17374 / SPN1) TaxID=760011 RepID=F4GLE4_PARC1|nr:ABC-F family ATP-binding cassette domain-containing protein [Parasphaerochaeta coccoides]AEC01914.1 ABC transporter related protein [Parasphaerochaeta coccoides DSM 17374]